MFEKLKNHIKKQWTFDIWIIIFLCVLIVGLLGRSLIFPLTHRNMNFWHYWEVAALGSTVVYNLLFYVLGFIMPPQMFKSLKGFAFAGVIPVLMLVAIGFLVAATIFSILEWSCSYQLLFIFLEAVCFLTLDVIMRNQSKIKKVREDFHESVVLNDIPACIAFFVLMLFSIIYSLGAAGRSDVYDVSFRAFIGGAIAFQMIISNWVVAMIFRKPGEWSEAAEIS